MDEKKALRNALAFIQKRTDLIAFVRDFDEIEYFVCSSDPRFREIERAIGDVHSGSSLEWCLRCCQREFQRKK